MLPPQGDGTTSTVLFCGDLLRVASRFIDEGVHPRIITDGFHLAKEEVTRFLESYKVNKPGIEADREVWTV